MVPVRGGIVLAKVWNSWRQASAKDAARQDFCRQPRTSGVRLTFGLSAIAALQVFTSFCIQSIIIAHIGVSAQSDALYAGATLLQLVTGIAVETFGYAIVPFLAPKQEEELREQGWQIFLAVIVVALGISALLALATPLLTPLMVPGFSGAQKRLAIRLAEIQVWGIVGTAACAHLTALYQVRNRFFWPPMAVLICSLTGLALLAWKLQVYGVSLAAWVQLLVVTVPALLLLGVLGRPALRLDLKPIKDLWRQMRPIMFGSAYYKSNVLADRWLGSFLSPGSIVVLGFVQRTYQAITRVMIEGIVTPIVPQMARLASDLDFDGLRAVHRRKLKEMFFINAIIVAGLVVLRVWGNHLVLASGIHIAKLDPQAIHEMIVVFVSMSGLMLCSGLNHSFTMAYYAQGNTVTPTRIWTLTWTLGLGGKVVGFFLGHLTGIAVAISLQSMINCILLWIFWKPGLAGVVAEERKQLSRVESPKVVAQQQPQAAHSGG
jgi:putative peptidoglycan lipid II flippase